jgi:spermidine synthase
MCEIDRQVCEVSKKYFRETLSTSFDDPRLTLMYDDAARYLVNEGITTYSATHTTTTNMT